MKITLEQAAELLRGRDNIVILAHRKPDGDTIGSCFALLYALESLGKTVRVECADGYPERFDFLYGDYRPKAFAPRFIVACDVAELDLLGGLQEVYPEIGLCVDHHKSNTLYARQTLLDGDAPAAAMVLCELIEALGVQLNPRIADALYTGLTTDTGCFRYSSVTAASHVCAAKLIECGARHFMINKLMFSSHSRGRVEVDKFIMDSLEFSHGDRCAIVSLPADIYERFSVTEDDLDGIAAFPRNIKGVYCGITIRANPELGSHRVSMRCEPPLDASRICGQFGGGGHTGAGGCTMTGPLDEVKARLRDAVGTELRAQGLCE